MPMKNTALRLRKAVPLITLTLVVFSFLSGCSKRSDTADGVMAALADHVEQTGRGVRWLGFERVNSVKQRARGEYLVRVTENSQQVDFQLLILRVRVLDVRNSGSDIEMVSKAVSYAVGKATAISLPSANSQGGARTTFEFHAYRNPGETWTVIPQDTRGILIISGSLAKNAKIIEDYAAPAGTGNR